jgi:putative ABC transport system permease protein
MAIALTPVDLALAASTTLLAGGLSLAAGLKLERSLALAVARMIAQLLLVAIVLKFVFEQTSALWTLAAAAVMMGAAVMEITLNRQVPGLKWPIALLSTLTLSAAALGTALFTVIVVIGPEPWYTPRYVVPILGMVLGNALTVMSLALTSMVDATRRERSAIETRLALGHTRLEAMQAPLRAALRTGLLPMINMLSTAGLVTLPGMMSGQILAGADPIVAAKYQIMILLAIAGAASLAAGGGAYGAVFLLTDNRHRLRLERLQQPSPK